VPITKSAKKALRQSKAKRKNNLVKKEKFKVTKKEILKLISLKNTDEAKKKLSELYKALDKAAKTNTIHKNKAARLKSRISRKLNKSK
jgi:small subunit ribosomal protein S20